MIPRTLEFRGLTRFRHPVAVDFDTMPDGLVAVAGGNGEGKTTVLEAMIVAVFGTFPTRPGSVYEYLNPPLPGEVEPEIGASGRKRKAPDAFVDFRVDLDGRAWRFRRTFDAKARSQGCQVWIDGEPANEGKTEEAAELVARHWPTLSQILASVFTAQGGTGSFLSMKPRERKDLIVRMLGLERLQELAQLALEESAELARAKASAADLVARCEASAGRLATARQTRTETRRQLEAATAVDQEAREAQAVAERAFAEAEADWSEAKRAADAAGVRVAEAVDAAAAAASAWHAAAADHAAALDAAGELEELRGLAGQVAELRRQVDQVAELHRRTSGAVVEAGRAKEHAAREDDRARAELARVDRQIADLGAVDDDAVAAAERDLAEETRELERAAQARQEAARLRPRVEQLRSSAEEERTTRRQIADAEGRAKLLEDVPCGGRVVVELVHPGTTTDLDCAACPLLVDATRARDSLEELRDDLDFVDGAAGKLEACSSDHAAAEAQAREAQARAGRFRGAEARLQAVRAKVSRLEELQERRKELAAAAQVATLAHDRCAAELERVTGELVEAPDRSKLEEAEEAARRFAEVAELAGAATARGELEERSRVAKEEAEEAVRVARGELEELRGEERRTAAVLEARRQPRQRAAEAARAAGRRLEDASAANARAAGAVEALEHAEGELEEARAALRLADQEAEDAALLASALGRDGVQAMELDAVGPAVSSIATEILRVVYGPRFVVNFVTQVLKAGAAGRRGETKEVFDVRVIDDERGTDGSASRLSGGERVVVSEAVKLALAVFAAQSGASKLRTLIRDESDGALDDERAAHYPAMLRRAKDLGGFARVLLVSHRPSNVAACDAVLRVAGGQAELTH